MCLSVVLVVVIVVAGLDPNTNFPLNLQSKRFVTGLADILTSQPLVAIQAYLRWHHVHTMAPLLFRAARDEDFRFFSQELEGVQKQPPRWKQCVAAVDSLLGHILYVAVCLRWLTCCVG